MNKNKGFISIGFILAIILGIVVIGGGAYYLGTKKNMKVVENNSHEVPAGPYGDETNYVAPPILCNSESKPSIKVLSPNGGEAYTAGQKIDVKWSSCNFRSNAKGVNIRVVWVGNLEALTLTEVNGTPNDGEELITLPSQEKMKDFYTNTFVVDVQMNIPGQNLTINGDESDNSFTINSVVNSVTSCTSDKGNSMTFQKALEIAKASSCNNIGKFTKEYNCNKNNGGLVDVYMEPTNKPGCGFACRVSIDTGKIEEGWMCTGALKPVSSIN